MAAKVSIGHTLPVGGTFQGNSLTTNKENENFFRLEVLLIEVGRKSLEQVFQNRCKGPLDHFLKQNQTKLQNLHTKKVIYPAQWDLLFPTAKIAQWDISLLCLLLSSICCLPPPKKGWKEKPDASELSISADIVRLRCYRNECHGHIAEASLNDADFNVLWTEIEHVILRLSNNTLKNDVTNVAHMSFERTLFQRLLKITHNWDVQDLMFHVENFKEYVDNLKDSSSKNYDQTKRIEKTLSKFEERVSKQFLKLYDNNSKMEKIHEKVSKISNETLGSIEKVLSVNDEKQDALLQHLENITSSLDTVLDVAELQRKTITKLDEHGDILRSNYDLASNHFNLAKSGDRKLDCLGRKIDSLARCIKGFCRDRVEDLSEDEESKDETFDTESSKNGKIQEKRKQNGNDVVKICKCSYSYTRSALSKYCDALLENGESGFFCFKCGGKWEYIDIRDRLGWSDTERRAVEKRLNWNFINKNKEIKHCPSCKRFCARKDTRNVRIVCLFCCFEDRRFEFCWQCLKEWTTSGVTDCGNSGCNAEPTAGKRSYI